MTAAIWWAAFGLGAIIGLVVGYGIARIHIAHRKHMHELRKAIPTLRRIMYLISGVVLLIAGGFAWLGVFG
jgi:uncharacterized membrane-anchored protein YhcB (DUF1043 family)